MAEEAPSELPIFELPVVILPGELMPLHIFEERYKRMIAHCLETEEPFGIVFRDEDGSARRIGCTARVTEILERFDDGRIDIVVTGGSPFRVLERFDADDYPVGEIEPVEAEAGSDAGDESVASEAREAFADLIRRVSGSEPEEGVTEGDAYAIAGRVELPVDVKQRLLELRSEDERMEVLTEALRGLVETLKRSREVAERARMNGKVVFD